MHRWRKDEMRRRVDVRDNMSVRLNWKVSKVFGNAKCINGNRLTRKVYNS